MFEREEKFVPIASTDIVKVRSKEKRGLYASGGPLYKDAIFGRDSIESAEDLLDINPQLAEEVIVTMASFQGEKFNPISEEEPGRIFHEHRSLDIKGPGTEISDQSKQILKKLSEKWGGTEQEMTYYGSVDATPLYVRLVADYVSKFGNEILEKEIIHKNGGRFTIKESLIRAVEWIENRLKTSELKLLEYKRTNPKGHANPVWKDSPTAYIHENGEIANHEAPIASIELQGLAFDALQKTADLFKNDPNFSSQVQRWRIQAKELQKATLENFWMEDQKYFALGIDRDPTSSQPRKIETISSNPGDLLDTTFFDDLPEDQKQKYISGIVETIYSPEFVTDVGLRCRALKYADILKYADYHGTWAVWIKETYDIAKGLRRQGFSKLAEQLETRIINGVNIAGVNYEFFYVDPKGRVNYNPKYKKINSEAERIVGTHIPEGLQAWTISAVLAIKRRWGKRSPSKTVKTEWQDNLEKKVLQQSTVPKIDIIGNIENIKAAFPKEFGFYIDRIEKR